ncbi:hypothetical protein HYV74_04560 [Candidatus Uhrbacteria bacterium]|nr:hypothetical protein [Candidatus Uhrbacteria bacterium]
MPERSTVPPIEKLRAMSARRTALLAWYREYGRHDLPWRHTRDPYAILISEVMLQQTQVDRVRSYWDAWMRRWPTVQALARARRGSVIRAWAGLGYNRRAVYLHQCAQYVTTHPWWGELFSYSHELASRSVGNRGFSDAEDVEMGALIAGVRGACAMWRGAVLQKRITKIARMLEELPGIGPYTSHALLAFAWNLPAPCVDTNIRRVLAHIIYHRPDIMAMSVPEVMRLAARVIPPDYGREWNYALMDYGALVFQARHVPNRTKRVVAPFKNSTRYWRGRIVAVLREHRRPLPPAVVRQRLRVLGECTEDVDALLVALVRDGVLAQHDAGFSLA